MATPALSRMLRKWDPAVMDCLLLLAPVATSIGYAARGDFTMSQDGRLARRGADEVVPFAFAGVSLCDERLFKNAPDGTLLAEPAYGIGRWPRASSTACGSTATGCMSARPEALAEAEAAFEREGA